MNDYYVMDINTLSQYPGWIHLGEFPGEYLVRKITLQWKACGFFTTPTILHLLTLTRMEHQIIDSQLHSMSFDITTAWKVSKYGVFSGPYFPVFGLKTDIYGVNLRIQSVGGGGGGRKNSGFGYFSRSVPPSY